MNQFITITIILIFSLGSSKSFAEDILLVCEGEGTYLLIGSNFNDQFNVTIKKSSNKAIKASLGDSVFTPKKVNIQDKEGSGPVYRQLIVEADRIILRTEVTDDEIVPVRTTIIYNTGAYEREGMVFVKGQCAVRDKVF